jgi:hypothetical protein
MVEEVLVRESERLSGGLIFCGEELLKRIDRAGLKVLAAFWVRDRTAEVPRWKLNLVLPEAVREDPLSVSRRINELTPATCVFDAGTIVLSSPDSSFFKQLKTALRSERKVADAWRSQFVVGNTMVDLYIYRFSSTNGHRI